MSNTIVRIDFYFKPFLFIYAKSYRLQVYM